MEQGGGDSKHIAPALRRFLWQEDYCPAVVGGGDDPDTPRRTLILLILMDEVLGEDDLGIEIREFIARLPPVPVAAQVSVQELGSLDFGQRRGGSRQNADIARIEEISTHKKTTFGLLAVNSTNVDLFGNTVSTPVHLHPGSALQEEMAVRC